MAHTALTLERLLMWWEDIHVVSRDKSSVDPATARAIADHVWQRLGVPQGAPVVTYVDPDDTGYMKGAVASMKRDGTQMRMYFPTIPTTVVLHELAHAMTEDPLRCMEGYRFVEDLSHGPVWLTNYLWLLNEFMGPLYNTFYLRSTLPPDFAGWSIGYAPKIWGR